MNNVLIIGIIISIILALSGFVASNNFIVGIVVLIFSILYFLLIFKRKYEKYTAKMARFDECYHFINTFIVTLSIKNSLSSALEACLDIASDNFKKNVENIETFNLKDKLDYIHKYFRFDVFSLFIDLVNIYEEEGGDILMMSHYLLEETRQIEEYISTCKSISKKRVVEFAILWILSLGIMVFLRFVLSSFFTSISHQIFYIIGIGAICIFCLVTIHIALLKMTNLKIGGWNDNEKI